MPKSNTEPDAAHLPTPPLPEQEFLPQPKVLKRYGVSVMSLRRWQEDRGFPTPLKIGARSFYRISELLAWERSLAVKALSSKSGAA